MTTERENFIFGSYAMALDTWVLDPSVEFSIKGDADTINAMADGPHKTASIKEWTERYHMARSSMPRFSPEAYALTAKLFNNTLMKAQVKGRRLDEDMLTAEAVCAVVSVV